MHLAARTNSRDGLKTDLAVLPRSDVSIKMRKDASQKYDRLRITLSRIKGPRILHLGCAGTVDSESRYKEHHLHTHLCDRFPEPESTVLGIDLDRPKVEALKLRGYNVAVGNAETVEFDEPFDTVLAGELIEHLSNPGAFLNATRRCIKTDGRLVLSTPNVFCPMFLLMYFKNFRNAFNPEHTAWFCAQTLTEALRRAGYRVVELEFADDLAPKSGNSRSYTIFCYLWALVRPFFPKRFRNTMILVCTPVK
jgi:2-polyprenyl-3-methyl-5-hydroxy-6-metoxy-1,4-benzoquinol methylase